MRKYAWLVLSMGLTVSLVGCGDDENNNTGGSGGSGGTAGSGGASTATVSGVVFAASVADDSVPFEGATVSVVGTSSTTTSGVGGVFSLESPVGTAMLLTTATGYWGELLPGEVPAAGLSDLDPEIVPDALVAEVADALSETVDPGKAIVGVEFNTDAPVGGEMADLGVPYGFAFVFNAAEEPVLGTTLMAGGGSEVVFVNVDIAADVMPTATNAGDVACSSEFPSAVYPSQAKVITAVGMVCP